jgi:molecular chaperone GrpE
LLVFWRSEHYVEFLGFDLHTGLGIDRLKPEKKEDDTVTADIPESVFEEALRAVEKIQAQTRQSKKDKAAEGAPGEPVSEKEELLDLMQILERDVPPPPAPARPKAREKAEASDSDLSVLTRLLEEEYNLEKEADFFKTVLFDTIKSESKVSEDLLKAKEGQIQELVERLTRIQGEFEKFRGRLEREFETAKRFSNEALILQILPILDNFERAIEHATKSEDKHAMVQGIRLIHKQLLDTLLAAGVKQIEAKGKPFDPAYHDAMVAIETNEVAPNLVVSEYSRGYLLHDRLLRPTKVVVSKRAGAPTPGEGEAPAEPGGGNEAGGGAEQAS